jgi:hypothetical protein
MEVLCKIEGAAVVVKSTLVFFVVSVKLSSDLAHVSLMAMWAG